MKPEACRWDGPKQAYGTSPLKYLYEHVVHVSPDGMKRLSRFFKGTLSVEDTSWRDVVNDLKSLRGRGCTDFDRIAGLYRYLKAMDGCADFETQLR